jgi:hypothetical protein
VVMRDFRTSRRSLSSPMTACFPPSMQRLRLNLPNAGSPPSENCQTPSNISVPHALVSTSALFCPSLYLVVQADPSAPFVTYSLDSKVPIKPLQWRGRPIKWTPKLISPANSVRKSCGRFRTRWRLCPAAFLAGISSLLP